VVETVDVLEETWLLNDTLALLVTDVSDDTLGDDRSLETAAVLVATAEDEIVGDGDGIVDVNDKEEVCCAATFRVDVDELVLPDTYEPGGDCDSTVTSLVTVVVLNNTWLLLIDENVSVDAMSWTCPSESCCTASVGCHGTVPVLV